MCILASKLVAVIHCLAVGYTYTVSGYIYRERFVEVLNQ